MEQIEDECFQSQEDKRFFDLRGYITYMRPDNMYYAACYNEKCMKKVSGDDYSGIVRSPYVLSQSCFKGWTCYSCNQTFNTPLYRYILHVKIEDDSGALWASVFNKEGEILMGIYIIPVL